MSKIEPGKAFHAPERVVERGRGCWNCIHFDNEDRARKLYRERISQERAGAGAAGMLALPSLGSSDGSVREVAHKAAEFIAKGHTMEEATNMALQIASGKDPEINQVIAEARRADARFRVFDAHAAGGQIGICMRGASGSDFVMFNYLCDKWSGREGASVATEGKPLDKLPEEVRAEVDEKAKKSS